MSLFFGLEAPKIYLLTVDPYLCLPRLGLTPTIIYSFEPVWIVLPLIVTILLVGSQPKIRDIVVVTVSIFVINNQTIWR